jgi:hypothetical protein
MRDGCLTEKKLMNEIFENGIPVTHRC